MTPFILTFTIDLALDNLIGNPRFLHKDRYCLWIRSEDTAAWRLTGTCQFLLCSQNAEAGVSLRFLNPKLMFLLSKLASSISAVSSWRIMLMGADGAISQRYQTFNTWTQRRNEFYADFEKQPPVHARQHACTHVSMHACTHAHTHVYYVHTDSSETKVSWSSAYGLY